MLPAGLAMNYDGLRKRCQWTLSVWPMDINPLVSAKPHFWSIANPASRRPR
ncbi:7293_t:CDS:1, partial [Gigaspora rosea]